MIKKLSVLLLAGVLGLGAKIWVNSIADPGAELGQGDWQTAVEGNADSARVSAHDSTRACEGNYSFLTDTDKDPWLTTALCHVWCIQDLSVPKAISDIDSCFWMVWMSENDISHMWGTAILFHSNSGKKIFWYIGRGSQGYNDSLCYFVVPLPDSGIWTSCGDNLYNQWINFVKWPKSDTIIRVELRSQGWKDLWWMGQEVSWDNLVLRSAAYYDYAAKSIDSDELTGLSFTPVATFANEGIKDDKDGWVYAEILEGGSRVYVDSQLLSIPKESSQQVTFAEWAVGSGGPYTLRVYPVLELDELSADDTLEQTLSAIAEVNPEVEPLTVTRTSSGILFTFAPGTQGELAIFDITGRQVYARRVVRDTPEFFWDTGVTGVTGVPAGLYFYRFVGSDLIINGRLVVLH